MITFYNEWDEVLAKELTAPYFTKLIKDLHQEYRTNTCYPPPEQVFNALRTTPYYKVKAVILGQDPYHGPGQAHGLCFSVPKGVDIPPSLRNIHKERLDDLGLPMPEHGDLSEWANEGVLLLNSILSVREHQPLSHAELGWQTFTDAVIKALNEREAPIVFLLWGAPARAKKALITNRHHLVLEAAHPSPLSAYRGFFGCRHFSRCNEFLEERGLGRIDWKISEKP